MQQQVDAERALSQLANPSNLFAKLGGRRQRAGQYAEAAGVRHFSDKFGACHSAHPRLNDRVFNAEQIA